MTKFIYKNRYKLMFVFILAILVITLSSCRMDSKNWYTKPYTTYAQEWIDLWNGGKGFWNTLWGWPINILSWPIAWLCSNIGKAFGNSYFWGIFFTTIIVRTAAWPIYSKQNGMSLKMQLMQPEIAKVQRKYAGRTDQRSQQMMQQEMMQVYKKNKVNPIGCVTTMFLQFPIFMSMYEVVQRVNATKTVSVDGAVSVEVAGDFALSNVKVFGTFDMTTSFFNAEDVKDKIFGLVIALLFGAVTFLQQKLGQRPLKYQKKYRDAKDQKQGQQQNQMKWMMIIMNVMFVFMSLSSTSLGIYWLIGGIYQIGQSQIGRLINERNYERAQKKNNIIG